MTRAEKTILVRLLTKSGWASEGRSMSRLIRSGHVTAIRLRGGSANRTQFKLTDKGAELACRLVRESNLLRPGPGLYSVKHSVPGLLLWHYDRYGHMEYGERT